MDYNQIIMDCETKMADIAEKFKEEIRKVQTGRANPQLVENLPVDYYGGKAPIKQVAAINVPEPRMIVITPWNKDDLVHIQKAVQESDLKVNPQNDGVAIRIVLPPLTEERRRELAKIISKDKEESRIMIRQVRENIWSEVQEMNREGGVSEDEKFRIKNKLQEVVDKHNKGLDELAEKKEEEIMKL